jgi:hypothetical protein
MMPNYDIIRVDFDMTNSFGELKTDYVFDTDNGVIISEKHRRVAEIIHDYNSELSLMWIPPSQRDETDEFPFVVVHNKADGLQYPVMWISMEQMDNPQVVLGRLFAGDLAKQNPDKVMAAIDAAEKADKIYREKEAQDRWEDRMNFLSFALETPLHTFKHNGKRYDK